MSLLYQVTIPTTVRLDHMQNGMVGTIQVNPTNSTCIVDQYRIRYRPLGKVRGL